MRFGAMLLAGLLLVPGLARTQTSQGQATPGANVTSLKGKFVDPTNGQAVAGVKVKLPPRRNPSTSTPPTSCPTAPPNKRSAAPSSAASR